MTLGIGVVGLGIAGSAMLPALLSHPGVRLVGAVDPDARLRAALTSELGVPAHADLDALLQQADLDAVYLATPHQFHRDQAIEVASRGFHVIVEKPMALTLEDCDAMIEAGDKNGVSVVVGHSHGFDPAVMLMRDLVAKKTYGALGMIGLWNYTDFMYRPRRPEELDAAAGGGIVYNQLPHQVDIVRTISPDVLAVTARTVTLDPVRRVPGACSAILDLAQGAVANLTYSGYDHFDSDELHGWIAEGGGEKAAAHASARARLRGLDADQEREARTETYGYGRRRLTRPTHQPHFGELVVTCARADLRLERSTVVAYTDDGIVEHPVPATSWWPGRGDVIDELVRAVRDNVPAVHDGRFGRESLRVCLAIDQSATHGRPLDLMEALV
jgi:phthalate 4,5-cis-dihydrodiol dehydrogenase